MVTGDACPWQDKAEEWALPVPAMKGAVVGLPCRQAQSKPGVIAHWAPAPARAQHTCRASAAPGPRTSHSPKTPPLLAAAADRHLLSGWFLYTEMR